MIIPPKTPVVPRTIPGDRPFIDWAPLLSRLVSTAAADPPPELAPAATDAARLPVADAAGVLGVTVLVGAETPLRDAATLNGAFPFES